MVLLMLIFHKIRALTKYFTKYYHAGRNVRTEKTILKVSKALSSHIYFFIYFIYFNFQDKLSMFEFFVPINFIYLFFSLLFY